MAELFGRDLDDLFALSVDELALLMLPTLVAASGGTVNWNNVRIDYRSRLNATGADEPTIRRFLTHAAAAWQWLRNETLLAPHHEQDPAAGWEMTTEAAASADSRSLADSRSIRLLRRADLHAALRERVVPIFSQGLYTAAVFQAMLEVEVRVREVSGLDLDGVVLMKEAFRKGGPLANHPQSGGDQEAEMALFWGAIGVFRNRAGHNRDLPEGDPQEAAEAILLANALMRIIGRRARSGQ